jgi:hypothetical protein
MLKVIAFCPGVPVLTWRQRITRWGRLRHPLTSERNYGLFRAIFAMIANDRKTLGRKTQLRGAGHISIARVVKQGAPQPALSLRRTHGHEDPSTFYD